MSKVVFEKLIQNFVTQSESQENSHQRDVQGSLWKTRAGLRNSGNEITESKWKHNKRDPEIETWPNLRNQDHQTSAQTSKGTYHF